MKGLIHLYCGEGKGKTTAAMGLALRAASSGKEVVIVQFLKDGLSGEVRLLSTLKNVTLFAGKVCDSFTWNMTEKELIDTKNLHNELLKKAKEAKKDVLILDEVCGACSCCLLDEDLLKSIITEKDDDLEIVLTGRNPKEYMIEYADYITNMEKIKHPFDKGIGAREGIEY